MYKLLLCWRYLRTRYIALASIISVTLGVATMIVVNSVMAGFTSEMQSRIHNILSDVVVEAHSLDGFPDPQQHMNEIRRLAGPYIAAMTPTTVVPAMLNIEAHGQWITRQVTLIGIDPATAPAVSSVGQYLQHPANRQQLSFELRDGGYDTRDHQAGGEAVARPELQSAGWPLRRWHADREKALRAAARGDRAAADAVVRPTRPDPFAARQPEPEGEEFDPAQEAHTGLILGIAIPSFRGHDGRDHFLTLPGQDVKITVPTAGQQPKASTAFFTIVDLYESKMSEYDSTFVFAPMRRVQELRGMIDPTSGVANVTAIQIKLKDERDGETVRDLLRKAFAPGFYNVQTWRDKQGPLLAAVEMETAILNVLLFLIIAVAGFGILAIFFMIVLEKTRDIGILKSLGAPARGVAGIFLGYGLSLGLVGSGVGMTLGLLFVAYINQIADGLAWLTGRKVFDPAIYYFQKIPTIVEPFTVAWIVAGALAIAVSASVLPALRAATLHPVEALRYE